MNRIESLIDAQRWDISGRGRLTSATAEEICAGMTTDVYFLRTFDVLAAAGLLDTIVTAEVFATRAGVMAGLQDALALLEGREVEVQALPEGTAFSGKDVVMRLRGRYREFGTLETALLGCLASASGWAAAACDCKTAAGDRTVVCFGARHLHPAVAPTMERAALIGGADGVSCVLAARQAGIVAMGTMPHALILIIGDTVEAARLYDRVMPLDAPRIALVDTFRDEAEEALRVAAATDLAGVRLDTPGERGGVTPDLVKEVRARLDQAGYERVQIFVSGGLNPDRIRELAAAGADSFGVGSYISGARAVDMTLDIKEIDGKPIAKRGRIPGLSAGTGLKRVRD